MKNVLFINDQAENLNSIQASIKTPIERILFMISYTNCMFSKTNPLSFYFLNPFTCMGTKNKRYLPLSICPLISKGSGNEEL